MSSTDAVKGSSAEGGLAGRAPRPRDVGLDALRGFLILCVIIGHFPGGEMAGTDAAAAIRELGLVIYLFHVPGFFLLSGLLIRKPTSIWQAIWDQRIIFCAFVIWGLVFNRGILHPFNPGLIARFFVLANWPSIRSQIWFLPCLISIRLLISLWLAAPVWGRGILLAISAAVVLFHGQVASVHALVPYGLDIAFYLLPAIVLARMVYADERVLKLVWPVSAAVFVACIAALYWLEPLKMTNGFSAKIDLAQFSTTTSPITYAILVLALLALVAGFRQLFHGHTRGGPFKWLGIYSMPVFILGTLVMYRFVAHVHPPKSMAAGLGYAAAAVALGCAAPMAISTLVCLVVPRRLAEYVGMAPALQVVSPIWERSPKSTAV